MLRAFVLRFALPVIGLVTGATLVAMPLIDRLLNIWVRDNAESRAVAVMDSIAGPLAHSLRERDPRALERYLGEVASREHLLAILVCRPDGTRLASTPFPPQELACPESAEALPRYLMLGEGSLQVSVFPLPRTDLGSPSVLLVQSVALMDRPEASAHDYVRMLVAVSAVTLSLVVVAAAWYAFRRWLSALLADLRDRRFQDDAATAASSRPLLSQLREVLREVESSQRLEIDYQENWTAAALQHVVRERLDSPHIMVISNREPYVHTYDEAGRAVAHVPASGMVTALEPIVRACGGTWIAHGSGEADRAVVDARDSIRVPPAEPSYRLRRVWLSAEQERGYYDGLANEGLWPLCHLAYVRPEFRGSDWRHYIAVNQQFARVVIEEAPGPAPLLLVQDYHFALLAAFVRARLADATIVHFWHIPWPNAETFGVCPWKRELISGLLQSDILGFHTRHHCLNFLDAVDRYVEGQIDRERMTVQVRDHLCQIAAYPVSIDWPVERDTSSVPLTSHRRSVAEQFRIPTAATLGLGIERWDFTKGILERFDALEHLFKSRPQLRGRLTFLQVVSPSRSRLPAYRELQVRTRARVQEINERHGRGEWQPIVLVTQHQEQSQLLELYRAADFCLVNSLHDGMNLVAKEFVAARDDDDGVLILSAFAGAARELVEALIVNPFDAIETANAIEVALHMPRTERRDRMRMMRQTVKHNNVFRWAGRMLMDASQIRRRRRLMLRSSPAQTPMMGSDR